MELLDAQHCQSTHDAGFFKEAVMQADNEEIGIKRDHFHPVFISDIGGCRGFNRHQNDALMQDPIMLDIVQKRGRYDFEIGDHENGCSRDADGFFRLQVLNEILERNGIPPACHQKTLPPADPCNHDEEQRSCHHDREPTAFKELQQIG